MYSLYIADDEKSVLTGLQKNVKWEKMGLKICGIASNGLEAYRDIIECNPDFALLDIRMPGMTGLEIIEQLQGKVDTLFLMLSGYDEFDYIKKAMDLDVVAYLLKPSTIQDVEHAFVKAIERRYNMHLLDKYYYNASHEEQIPEKLGKESPRPLELFPILESFYAFFCVRIGFERSDFLFGYLQLRKELENMNTDNYSLFPYQVTNGLALIVAFQQTNDLNTVRREAENKICTAIRNKTEQMYYGMGNIVFLPEQIEKSLARASIIMDYCMFAKIEPQEIARESSIAGNKSIMDLTTEFVDVVTDTHSKIDLKTEVDHLLNDLMNGELSIEQIKWICADMIYNIHYKILNEYNIQIESIIMQNNISKSLLSVNKLDDFRKFLNQTLESIREYIGVYHQDGSSSVINRIKQYIQSNINKQFTLEEISDKFYLNPAYVSYIFKKETGINLFSYIAEQRIFKAKHLLRNTNMKIADIALEIGYRDQRYFCQVFKQKCGITASEYRENYGENKGKYS